MTFLCENLWFWIAAAAFVAVVGYVVFVNNRKTVVLGMTIGAAVVVLLIGLVLFFYVDTDRKSVSRMLTHLAAAIEADDVEKVMTFISPKADKTRKLARGSMAQVRLPSARFKNLKVEVNSVTHPPTAKVTFLAVVRYIVKDKSLLAMEKPMPQLVEFDVELEKTNENSWLVTNKCDFTPNAVGAAMK